MNQPPDISQYRPPKRHGGWIAVIIVTALVVALVIVARRVTTEPANPVTPTPSPHCDVRVLYSDAHSGIGYRGHLLITLLLEG
ncbi:hypothetical protein JCM18920_472 [Cutibacterium acnes JCM 18920]|nr:hypothetical protein JCM18920_472 [Cutibacterium acnes JCM 18920]